MELRRRRQAVPARRRGAPHPVGASVRSGARRPYLAGRTAAPPDHGGLRGDAAAPAAAIPAGGRPGRRQDHHGRPPDEGDDRAGRSAAMPRRLPGQSGRAVAGRAVSPLPPQVRHSHERQARSLGDRQLVPRHEFRHRQARQALPQRRRPGEAARAGLLNGTWSSATRRTSSRRPSSAAR